MSYQLNLDQILEGLAASRHPEADTIIKTVENVANHAALKLAAHLGVKCNDGTFEGVAFAGLCVPFYPAFDGQPLPDVFEENAFDDAEEWS